MSSLRAAERTAQGDCRELWLLIYGEPFGRADIRQPDARRWCRKEELLAGRREPGRNGDPVEIVS